MTIPQIEEAAGKLAIESRVSEVEQLAGLVRELARETNESLEFLAKTKADDKGEFIKPPGGMI